MNILSFDIEEWALAKERGYGSVEKCAQYDACLNKILDALAANDIQATFFCTGAMAEYYPEVVKTICSRGHEIGCHSYQHTWMNKIKKDEALEDTQRAIDSIEQCVGVKIQSYRAPAFSIGEKNKWMIEILAECGIIYDASIFPAERNYGGFPEFSHKTPCIVEYNGIRIKEFPICTTSLLGKEVAYSGGGYFRLFPLWFVLKELEKSQYAMFYFHMADMISDKEGIMPKKEYEEYFKEPGTIWARYLRYIKTNFGVTGNQSKFNKLLGSSQFINIAEADRQIDWTTVPSAVL